MGAGTTFVLDACAHAGIEIYTLQLTTPGRNDAQQGSLNPTSVLHSLRLYCRLLLLLLTRRVSRVYIPIAQGHLPLARDLAFVLTASVLRAPVVIHLHGSQLVERVSKPTRLRDCFVRRILRSHSWGVLSPALRDLLLVSGAARSAVVLRNPANQTSMDAAEPIWPHVGRPFAVGFLGYCSRRKGLDILITAVRALRAESEVDLVVAGYEGDVKPSSFDWLTYLGKLSQSELDDRFWPHIDVLVLPSRVTEGLPFVVLEALAHRKLVLAAGSLGLRELTAAGAVLTITPRVEHCAQTLLDAQRDFGDLLIAQQLAWQRIKSQFDPDVLQEQWLTRLGLLSA